MGISHFHLTEPRYLKPFMTPYELYQTYRNLSVDLHDGRTIYGLDIHKYRNNSNSGGISGTGAGHAAYEKLKAKVAKAGKKEKLGGYVLDETDEEGASACLMFRKIERVRVFPDLWRVFVGKGSPEEIRQALRLAVFFKLVASDKGALQSYCDDNIGLDCSGFAGNLYGGEWVEKGADYFRDHGTEVRKLEDIRANDAICCVDTNHIVVIDRVYPANKCLTKGDPVLQSMAAESTGAQMLPNGPNNGILHRILLPSDAPSAVQNLAAEGHSNTSGGFLVTKDQGPAHSMTFRVMY